ncbi:2-phospho-L-lactate transferase CofD family protein [Fluviispira multicolorata]|uniref:Glycosyltransferase n=1 Tax=Fluviispira multicolorata TaxID=2654512 RepID=A0A833N379_9BACT|nr:2-phospho-L-lactate transferase CofD family protein [Fluviispira multicolorata]KAB8027999.1 glycosyltransferase [Fluviispira multicolorata]
MLDKINVVIFSGGRGSASLTTALLNHEQINLKVLVNAYDDGLSTGLIRNLIPGMLGPSDIRKNIFRQIELTNPTLAYLLEYRFPIESDNVLQFLKNFINNIDIHDFKNITSKINNLKHWQVIILKKYIKKFLENVNQDKLNKFNFSDCSFGNILMAGCYLKNNHDFNKCINEISQFSEITGQVLNITDGKNYVLIALKEDGKILLNESEIVSKQDNSKIKEIYLLENYLLKQEIDDLNLLSLNEKAKYLNSKAFYPEINPESKYELENADVIIYAPGTQHSSLFPSYITKDLADTIHKNKKSEKIFIGNIFFDHEIQSETCNSLAKKFLYYMNMKDNKNYLMNDFATSFFFQIEKNKYQEKYISFQEEDEIFPKDRVILTDWEDDPGKHLGGRILDEIISKVNQSLDLKIKDHMHLVSIIVPVKNEEKYIANVLNELNLVSFQNLGLGKEIIVIDGNSTDNTFNIVSKFENIKLIKTNNLGRGHCLKVGVSKARGNIIIFFPGDGEYKCSDLNSIVSNFRNNLDCQVVFGSRSIKCLNLDERIRYIYGNNYFGYFSSKWGGRVLSILTLILYNRYITDPLTSVKGFKTRFLKSLDLTSNGVELEMEIIAKTSKKMNYILETSISYKPRTRSEGKKTNVWDGIKCIFSLIYFFYQKKGKENETFVNYNSSIQ